MNTHAMIRSKLQPGSFEQGLCRTAWPAPPDRSLFKANSNLALEREADLAAEDALAGRTVRSISSGRRAIQRRALPSASSMDGVPGSVSKALAEPGTPLQGESRARMEQAFGRDFSHIRVHSGDLAARSAREIQARAYTVDQDIVFGRGQFHPDTREGSQLLAHELAHTVQQDGQPPRLQRDVDEDAVAQCVAELGGSPKYRDGGLPSTEELERYRRECLARQKPAEAPSRAIENLRAAWGFAKETLRDDLRAEVEHLFTPQALVAMGLFAAIYIGSQLTPAGWVADALALTALTLTVIFVGTLVIDIAKDLYRFFSVINATTEEEQRAAGAALSRVLSKGAVAIFIALLTRGVRGAMRPPGGGAPPTAAVEVVTPTGPGLRFSAATAGEAVEASRLQSLASYAVIVPPPGGNRPSAPDTSSSQESSSGSGSGKGPATTPAAGFKLGRTGYGADALSQLAQRMRIALGLRRGGNVAVFEFEDIPAGFRELVRRNGGRNVQIEGNRMAVQNVNGSAHSEQLADMLIRDGQRAGYQLNVKRIYTEYNPCTDTCLPLIQRRYPNAQVSFSFTWERWGRQTPDRNAAVEALFNDKPASK